MKKFCGRCKKLISRKPLYRIPYIHKEDSGELIYNTILIFCDKCVKIFDEHEKELLLKNNPDNLQKFYEQYKARDLL